jgi:hypothetical protein
MGVAKHEQLAEKGVGKKVRKRAKLLKRSDTGKKRERARL